MVPRSAWSPALDACFAEMMMRPMPPISAPPFQWIGDSLGRCPAPALVSAPVLAEQSPGPAAGKPPRLAPFIPRGDAACRKATSLAELAALIRSERGCCGWGCNMEVYRGRGFIARGDGSGETSTAPLWRGVFSGLGL